MKYESIKEVMVLMEIVNIIMLRLRETKEGENGTEYILSTSASRVNKE